MEKKCWICRRTESEVNDTKYYSIFKEQYEKHGDEKQAKPIPMMFKRFYPAEGCGIDICTICFGILKGISFDTTELHERDFHTELKD